MPTVTVHTKDVPSFHHACEEEPLCTLHHGFREILKKKLVIKRAML